MSQPRILITGGAGFIGSHLAEAICADGGEVVVVDNLATGQRSNLAHLPADRWRLIEGDAAAVLPELDREGSTFTHLFHLAATVGVSRVMADPGRMMRNNLHATEAALDFALRHRLPVLLASSSEVYGGGETQGPLREDQPVCVGPASSPRWGYALTKALDEQLALTAWRESRLPAVAVRLFNTIGPRQVGAYGMVVPRMVEAALRGEPVIVYGDGQQTRTFCDVADVVRALRRLLDTPACHGEVFNVGTDQPVRIGELASLVVEVTSSSSRIEPVSYASCPERLGEPQQRLPDISKLRERTGWSPEINLRASVQRVAQWMRSTGVGVAD